MKYFVIDAFTEKVFQGNPAGVCILEKPLKQKIMQNIAKENNLSETAFVYKEGEQYFLKWFTPKAEIDLCGHATMAAAYVVMNFIEKTASVVTFHTKSGLLTVEKKGNMFEMDLPCRMPEKIDVIEKVTDVIGIKPVETYISRDLILLLENEKRRICINMEYIQNLIHSRVLKKTEREMLNDRFIEGMKYDELSIKYGYGQRYIYDIVEAIIEKLHAYLVKNKLIVETI